MKKEFPQKWAYKLEEGTQDRFKEILDKAGIKHFWNLDSLGDYYMISDNSSVTCHSYKEVGYTPVTLQELQDHYLPKLAEAKEKKILGYKAPFDLFAGKVEKGTTYPATETDNYTHPYFVPMEIVKTWEPVYAPKYKVGDIVTTLDGFSNDYTKNYMGAGYKPNYTFKVYSISDNSTGGYSEKGDQTIFEEGKQGIWSNGLRLATEEEIKEWKKKNDLPTIAGYTAEIIDGRAEFGCVKLNEDYLKAIKYLLTSSANAKITVHDTDITTEMIDKLLKALE